MGQMEYRVKWVLLATLELKGLRVNKVNLASRGCKVILAKKVNKA